MSTRVRRRVSETGRQRSYAGALNPCGTRSVQRIPVSYSRAFDLGSLRAMAVNALPMVERLVNAGHAPVNVTFV